jgi:hypothetical protein
LGTSLEEKVLKPLLIKPAKSMLKKLRKPLLVIVITDGKSCFSCEPLTPGAPYNEKGVKHNRDKRMSLSPSVPDTISSPGYPKCQDRAQQDQVWVYE